MDEYPAARAEDEVRAEFAKLRRLEDRRDAVRRLAASLPPTAPAGPAASCERCARSGCGACDDYPNCPAGPEPEERS